MGAAGPLIAAMDNGDDTGWMGFALCTQTTGDAWFPEQGDSSRPAKKVCAQCFVRAECAEYAIADASLEGIWGGLSMLERRAIRRERAA
jgi:WhiB family redox-sensing transcriptional regulator